MPPRDPNIPQLDFPQLVADLIQQLRLIGPVGLLDFVPAVQPVYLAAMREGLSFTFSPPSWASAECFNGKVVAPAGGAIVLDTGQLAAGTYDVSMGFSFAAVNIETNCIFQWRDAPNTGILAEWPIRISGVNPMANAAPMNFALEIGLNERLRFINDTAMTGSLAGYIMAARRPVP